MSLSVASQCRRCSLGNQTLPSFQDFKLMENNGLNSKTSNGFGVRKKKNSCISLVNSRAFWPYPSAHAIAAAGGVSECHAPVSCSTSLEFEALAAVHRLSVAVRDISVSEMLPRTPQLIFVNVTTLEGQPYCLELTAKGWRITSLRSDCMQGDFTRMELFTVYYESIYDLMSVISPSYKNYSASLTSKRKASDSVDNEDFNDEIDLSSYDDSSLNNIPNSIQLCPTCSCASIAVGSPPKILNTSNENDSATSDLIFQTSLPSVTTCRCGTARRTSSVGSQALEENESDRLMMVERLRLLHQRCNSPMSGSLRRLGKSNSVEIDTSISSDDEKNIDIDGHHGHSNCSTTDSSLSCSGAASSTSSASSRRHSQLSA